MSLPSHSGFYKFVKEKYDKSTLLFVRRSLNTSKRIARQCQHLAFNSRSKRYSLIPFYLRTRPLLSTQQGKSLAYRFSRQSLLEQIAHNHRVINRLSRELVSQECHLSEVLSNQDFDTFLEVRRLVQSSESLSCKTRQKRKFDNLIAKSQLGKSTSGPSSTLDRWVVNLSDTTLDHETELLRKSLNFVPAPSTILVSSFISSVEKSLSKIPSDLVSSARKQVANILARSRPPSSNMPPRLRKALKSLRQKDHLVILPADKGQATVVMNKDMYDSKMISMLSNSNTYEKLTRDPAASLRGD